MGKVEEILALYRAPIPTVEEALTDPFYLGGIVKACPSQVEVLKAIFDPSEQINIAGIYAGLGWGKSMIASVALYLATHNILALKSPQEYYGLSVATSIKCVAFSVREAQAYAIIFENLLALIDQSPAFQRPGFKRDTRVKSALKWPDRRVEVFAGTSKSASAIGHNILAAVIDEASWFVVDSATISKASSSRREMIEDVRTLGDRIRERMKSRGGNDRWRRDTKLIVISSPRTVTDWLNTDIKEEAQRSKHVYFTQRPTWDGFQKETLSGKTFHDPVAGQVPVEYKDSFESNPESARRSFAAIPSAVVDSYFSDYPKVLAAGSKAISNLFNKWMLDESLPPRIIDDHEWFFHIDLGLKQDSCGIAGGYVDFLADRVVVPALTYLTAKDEPFKAAGEIDFSYVRGLIIALKRRGLNIACVTTDGWQSVDTRQALAKEGITTELLSIDRNIEPYNTLKSLIYTERIVFTAHGRAGKLFDEIKYLELINGKKVDHPAISSKDLSDAAAGVAFKCAPFLESSSEVVGVDADRITQWGDVENGWGEIVDMSKILG